MRSITFPYSLYQDSLVPIIPCLLFNGSEWFRHWAYVDSGATYSIFSMDAAERMGLDLRNADLHYIVVGDGGRIPTYLKLKMRLGDIEFPIEVGFLENLNIGFNLLGRKDIFEKFQVCFNDAKRVVSFHWSDEN